MAAPQIDNIAVAVGFTAIGRQLVEGRSQRLPLARDQSSRIPTPTLVEAQLDQELDAKVANVFDGKVEPSFDGSFAGFGRAQHGALGAGIARFGLVPFGQSGPHQSVKGPVHERAMDGQDPAKVTVARQFPGQGEAMNRRLGQESQNHPLGEREIDRVGVGRISGLYG